MSVVSDDTKDRVRQAIDIVDLAGKYLGDLRREGRIFKALCPWHDDHKPSLQINPERQSFKCWVCDIGGDVFSFVMQIEGVEFREALTMLAERAGIPLVANPSQAGATKPNKDEKTRLFEAAAWAERTYHDCLLSASEAEPARKYLTERGIEKDSWHRFHLGFAPDDWSWLSPRADKLGYSPALLTTAGVMGKSQAGRYFDRFKGRVLFSIRDMQHRTVGLGGRVLPIFAKEDSAKYVNSPETPLFSKSKLLYGLDLARDEIRKSGTAIVVEGYTDCIVAHQCGLSNVVAVMGTALTEQHIKLLRQLSAERIVLVLDGDEAGRRRANEMLELFVARQVDLRILTLPDDLDPCDYLLRRGTSDFQRELETAPDALEHQFQLLRGGLNASGGTHAAHAALEEVLGTLAKAPRLDAQTASSLKLREARMLSRLAHLSGVVEETLRQRLTELRRGTRRAVIRRDEGPNETATTDRAATWERELFEVLLLTPELFDEVQAVVRAEWMQSPRCRRLFEAACQVFNNGLPPDYDSLCSAIDDPGVQSLLVEFDEDGRAKREGRNSQDLGQELRDILHFIESTQTKRRQGRETALLKESQVADQAGRSIIDQIIEQQREQQRARQGIT